MSRLIDADALREQLQNLAYDDWNQGVSTSWADAYREIADMVEDAPTIEQERKGEWIPIQRGFFNKEVTQVKCDQCGNLLDLIGVNCGRGDANYCPNCGARMSECAGVMASDG